MATAIILIPEMLSGPDRNEPAEQATAHVSSGTELKTYSIDLNHPLGASSNAQAVPDERAPPPEDASSPANLSRQTPTDPPAAATPSSDDESNPDLASRDTPKPQISQPEARTSSAPADAQPASKEPTSEQPPAAKPAETPPARAPLASAPSVPTSPGWAVQLGSFSTRASAEGVAADFRTERDNVFVMPVKSHGTTLYRVRIGPMPDRAAAEDVLRRVRKKVPGAAVVTHP